MSNIDFHIISTGSKGNAVVFNNEILVDCGVPFKALREFYRNLKLVLLTHIHQDHFNPVTIRRLAQERPTLRFSCCEWLVEPLFQHGVSKSNIYILETGKKYNYGRFSVSPISLYHNVPNCGYRLYFGNEKVLYATDTSTLDGISAIGYDYYFLEANYTDEDLAYRIAKKEAAGEYVYERDVPNRHLSKRQCDTFFNENAEPHSRLIYLHQHQD